MGSDKRLVNYPVLVPNAVPGTALVLTGIQLFVQWMNEWIEGGGGRKGKEVELEEKGQRRKEDERGRTS